MNLLFGAKAKAPTTSLLPERGYYDSAQQYMDPRSSVNRGHFDRLRNNANDMSASAGLMGQRGQSAGVNPFANEQYRQDYRSGQGQALGAYSGVMGQQQNAGLNMMGLAMQGDMANQSATNQANQLQWQANQQRQQGISQFWSGLIGQGVGAVAPGFGSMIGGGNFGDAYKWGGKE